MENVVISVTGMVCMSCVQNIEAVVGERVGVQSIKVSLEQSEANIDYDSSLIKHEDLVMAIDDMGFEAAIKTAPTSSHLIDAQGEQQEVNFTHFFVTNFLVEAKFRKSSSLIAREYSLRIIF